MPTQCPQYPHNAHNAHTMPTIPTQCPQYPHNAHTIPTQCPQCHTIPTQCPHNTHTMPTQYPHNAHNAYAMPTMATQCPHNAHNTYTIPTQCPHNAHVPCSRLRRSRFQSQSLVTTRQTAMRQVSYLHILIYFALISSVRSFDWMNRYNILYRRKKTFHNGIWSFTFLFYNCICYVDRPYSFNWTVSFMLYQTQMLGFVLILSLS